MYTHGYVRLPTSRPVRLSGKQTFSLHELMVYTCLSVLTSRLSSPTAHALRLVLAFCLPPLASQIWPSTQISLAAYLLQVFEYYDLDGSGLIDADEFGEMW